MQTHEKPIGEEAEAFLKEAEARGYRRFQHPLHNTLNGYLFSIQTRVQEGEDTLYFLNVDAWDMSVVSRGAIPRLSLEAEVQFRTEDGSEGHPVNVSTPFIGFEETEAFFGRLWRQMEFGRTERHPESPGPG
jgi:hypothetical protein